jgi:hypothetical protein
MVRERLRASHSQVQAQAPISTGGDSRFPLGPASGATRSVAEPPVATRNRPHFDSSKFRKELKP